MIDILSEHLVPIRDAAKLLPRQSTGKRVHISAVYRWIDPGLRGVQLESIKIGGTTYTSTEALQRFGERRSTPGPGYGRSETSVPAPVARRKQIERAANEVDTILGKNIRPIARDRQKKPCTRGT